MGSDEPDPALKIQDSFSRAMITRRFHRVTVEIPCLYSLGGPDWNGTAINLSRGGCAILGTSPVKKGDYLRVLLFPAENQPPIEVGLAPVRWTTGEQFGVEFITLKPQDAQRLHGYLAFIQPPGLGDEGEAVPR